MTFTTSLSGMAATLRITTADEHWWDPFLDAELPPMEPFRFLDLPAELRLRVYQIHLQLPYTVDLDPSNHKKVAPLLQLFSVNRQVYEEAFPVFYGNNTFRLFCIHGRFFGSRHHLLTRMRPRTRGAIVTMELRLGTGFTAPPKTWKPENVRLALATCKNLRHLKVFADLDPMSYEVFEQWRMPDDGFSKWSAEVLRKTLEKASAIETIEFDANPSVRKNGHLMSALLKEAEVSRKRITFGPLKGWTDGPEIYEEPGKEGENSMFAGGFLAGYEMATASLGLLQI